MSESVGSCVHRSNHQRAQVGRSERRGLCRVGVRVQVLRHSAIRSSSHPTAERAAYSTAVFSFDTTRPMRRTERTLLPTFAGGASLFSGGER